MKRFALAVAMTAAAAAPAAAQVGQIVRGLQQQAEKAQEFIFTDAEERELGASVSERLRLKYGVVQSRDVHRYVTLVGAVVAGESARPGLEWTFIVLDTDGVNAFAAPGGFVHITRGALALVETEAELAGVLAHEIAHVTAKHTIRAIQKAKVVEAGAQQSRSAFLKQVSGRAYELVLENAFDRGDETEADRLGATTADKAGYAPAGLGSFLQKLAARNKDLTERSGLFASHPELRARQDALAKHIASSRLAASATVAARYREAIAYRPVPVSAVEQTDAPAPAPAQPASRFGLGSLTGLGRERSGSQTIASAGSRGVNPDRDARGGPVKTAVVVTVTPAEVAAFRRGITG